MKNKKKKKEIISKWEGNMQNEKVKKKKRKNKKTYLNKEGEKDTTKV